MVTSAVRERMDGKQKEIMMIEKKLNGAAGFMSPPGFVRVTVCV